ncbi:MULTISPECIES: hypothetical protein [unclassified Arcicella]|uniref:hypothetical protein n=1 Tax=unclassified Arcicella TaxID=2644986 RepID=UPI0028557A6B|nr:MULTISPECIES: hypothetical protein [unclassified Arcicella]MDR6563213.1 hypothetical protein [Arcicella sp. BE51]MDR6811636.1 hypothetical protein [Arcicella sp. BE140]MDR6823162.1 hypothetical protein [Arcicella sp. BE139]
MKFLKFILKLFLIGFLPLLAIDSARKLDLIFDPRSKNAYIATIIDKTKMLATVPSPRLVLMSGSSMAFGINSDMLENEIGLPVVNAALHFNFGSKYMMEELKTYLKKGDVVLITLEYMVRSEGKYEEQLIAADFYPPSQKWIHFPSITEKISSYTTHRLTDCRLMIGEALNHSRSKPISIADTTSIFYRNCFSPKGDLLCHLNNPPTKIVYPTIPSDQDFSQQIKDLNDFYAFAQQKGAKVFFTFPCLAQKSFEENANIIKKISAQIKRHLKIPILGTPQYALMDDTLFYDNAYHPNDKGREIFTKRILTLFENSDKFQKSIQSIRTKKQEPLASNINSKNK